MWHTIKFFMWLIGGCHSLVQAQSRDTVMLRKLTQKDGLSSYNIRKIIQDEKGFIWIATQDGISRFDGKAMQNYSKNAKDKYKICGTDVKGMEEDTAHNLLWVLPGEVGINAISTVTGEVIKTVRLPQVSDDDWNVSLLKMADRLWIGTSTGVQIFNTTTDKYESGAPLPDRRRPLGDFAVWCILKDANENAWVCYERYGVVIYDGRTKKILRQISLSELNDAKQLGKIRVLSHVLIGSNEVLLATNQGLRRILYSASYQVQIDDSPCPSVPELNRENINSLYADGKSTLLVAGFNRLYRFTNSLQNYQVVEELSRNYETDWLSAVLCIYKDRESNLWFGCQEGLAFMSKNKAPFRLYNYDKLTSKKLDHVRSILPLPNKNILAGLANGIVAINDADGKYNKYDEGRLYHHLFQTPQGVVFASRRDSLFVYNNGRLSSIAKSYPEFDSFATYSLNSHLFINDTLTILGTENNKGILLWNPVKRWVKSIDGESGPPRLAANIVNNIYRDKQGRIWVLSDNVITILSADLRTAKKVELHEATTGLSYKLFFDMCEAAGSYWIASYGSGILEVDTAYRVERVFNTQSQSPLSNDGVYQVYPLPGNYLLVTSNNGLSRINLATGKISRYYVNDGLHSNAFEEVSGTMKNGKIYAGGVNGFTIIDPTNFLPNLTPPQLYFTGIETKTADGNVSDTANLLMEAATIKSNVFQTTIRFAGLNYANPERTEYFYRILENGNDWISLGTQNFLQPIGLGPGTYTLEVKAANEDGVESGPIKLQLYFQPKWFQTWWLKTLLILAVLAAAYGLYRFRIGQIKREERLRRRLASDLHDDLGSTMNSVKIYTSLAMMEDSHNSYLQKIKDGTQDVIAGIRDVVWILDDKKDTLEQLVERIDQFARPLCEAKQIAFAQETDGGEFDITLGKEEKRNLYMILKEAINNSVKYAECKTITLRTAANKTKLSIRIADDGKGFDPTTLMRGNGLNNIERRAKEIGFAVAIKSVPGEGTVISLSK